MVVIQFFENKSLVLSQLLKNIPSVDDNIKIKGRKGKVVSVEEIHEGLYHIQILFEKVVKKQAVITDNKRKRR